MKKQDVFLTHSTCHLLVRYRMTILRHNL
uniref:Uncharacterized protein n=1 Tax=Anguilla anguilla TaxID=7936 RepID=A0A0E9T4A4_ANGAN